MAVVAVNRLDELDPGDELLLESWTGSVGNDTGPTPLPNLTEATTTPYLRPMYDPNLYLMRFICEVVLSLPIAILGIIGNLLAFVVYCNHKHKLTTTVLLQALAICDTLVLISSILLRCLRYVGWAAYQEIYHYVFLALFPMVYFFRLADTWLTVLLTIDRFIAVCYPLHAQRLCTMRRTYILIAVLLLCTFAFSLPRFFEYTIHESTDFKITPLVFDKNYVFSYRIALFFLAAYLTPMLLLIVLNTRLVCTLRRANAYRAVAMQHISNANKREMLEMGNKISRSITTIVVTVVVVCILCNVVAMAVHVIYSLQICFREELTYLEPIRRYLANVSNLMITINCGSNFIIYCMCSRNFRAVLKRTFQCGGEDSLCPSASNVRKGSSTKRSSNTDTTSTNSIYLTQRMSLKNPLKVHLENGDVGL